MKSESFLHQKKVRAMGTFLAVISCIALVTSLLFIPFGLFMSSSWFTGATQPEENAEVLGDVLEAAELPQDSLTDEDIRKIYAELYQEIRSERPSDGTGETFDADINQEILSALPDDTTEETFINTMIYLQQVADGEEVPIPEEGVIEEWVNPIYDFLPEGVRADTTVAELVEKDLAFFREHTGTFRLLSFLAAAFYAAVAVIILRMALSWRKGDPFGRKTILSLRWLAILFIAQFLAGYAATPFLPYSDYSDLLFHATIYDVPIEILFGGGANLSCGLVLLTLSWVLEHGKKMKDEQALTI